MAVEGLLTDDARVIGADLPEPIFKTPGDMEVHGDLVVEGDLRVVGSITMLNGSKIEFVEGSTPIDRLPCVGQWLGA